MMQLSSKNDDSSLCYDVIQNFNIEKFGDFSSDIDFKTKMDIFIDDISLVINQCHLQAPEGSLLRTQSVGQPLRASKRSAFVSTKERETTNSMSTILTIRRLVDILSNSLLSTSRLGGFLCKY